MAAPRVVLRNKGGKYLKGICISLSSTKGLTPILKELVYRFRKVQWVVISPIVAAVTDDILKRLAV